MTRHDIELAFQRTDFAACVYAAVYGEEMNGAEVILSVLGESDDDFLEHLIGFCDDTRNIGTLDPVREEGEPDDSVGVAITLRSADGNAVTALVVDHGDWLVGIRLIGVRACTEEEVAAMEGITSEDVE
jgi:hypothetical protein